MPRRLYHKSRYDKGSTRHRPVKGRLATKPKVARGVFLYTGKTYPHDSYKLKGLGRVSKAENSRKIRIVVKPRKRLTPKIKIKGGRRGLRMKIRRRKK